MLVSSQNTVVVVSGEPARVDFFACKGLDINEGFKVLSGAVGVIHSEWSGSSEFD